jgi:two-component system response regulator YesN
MIMNTGTNSVMKVLVVDDELPVRQELRSFDWKSNGAELAGECEDGKAALEFCGQNRVDVIISDITMPSMDGINLFTQIRHRYPAIQLFVLTCHRNFDYAHQMLRLGVLDYLVKVNMKDEDIVRVLEKARASIERNRLVEIGALEKKRNTPSCPSRPEIKRAQAYIDAHLETDLSLSSVAAQVGLSSYYLSHLFPAEIGIPFSEYVIERRLKQAKKLLKTTNLKIYEAAYKAGFPNYRYFSLVFKKRFGITPKECRKSGEQ